MEMIDTANDPFRYPYGILFTTYSGRPSVKSYRNEEERDRRFEEAKTSRKIRRLGEWIEVVSMVKFQTQGVTYSVRSDDNG